MIIKQKRKDSSKKYRENKKMKKNIANMLVKDKNVSSLHENAEKEQIDDFLNKSVASIVSNVSSNESSSGEINYDCNSSCNTSILDQTNDNSNSNDTLLPFYENSTITIIS
jgi:hypothetical protein